MLTALITIIIIVGFALRQYYKSSLVKSFVVFITAVCAAVLAFNYFELLAGVFYRYDEGRIGWAQPGSFILIFIVTFATLRTIGAKLIRQNVQLPTLPDHIGAVIFAVMTGLIITGLLLSSIAMMPIATKWPYQRFDASEPDISNPAKTLLNPDGFATGLFGMLSKGSFSGKKSFTVLHPDFLDQRFLSRAGIENDVKLITGTDAIIVPAAWPAPENLTDTATGQLVEGKLNQSLIIVRVGIKPGKRTQGGAMDQNNQARFTLSQLRLICKEKTDEEDSLKGNAKTIYPEGYLRTSDALQKKTLYEEIVMKPANFSTDPNYGKIQWLDLAFYLPKNHVPVLIEFKQNAIAQVVTFIASDQAPQTIPFIQSNKLTSKGPAQLHPVTSARIHGLELAAGDKLLDGLSLPITTIEDWQQSEKPELDMETRFDGNKISYARTRLIPSAAGEEPSAPRRGSRSSRRAAKAGDFYKLLSPPLGYRLVSLKCNAPPAGAIITPEQLPAPVEPSGKAHNPIGLIAAGMINNQTVYEVDYCGLTIDQISDGLVFDADACVANPFPEEFWLPQKAQRITELYIIYLVKPETIITSVRAGGSKTSAGLKKYEGFIVE